MTKDKRKRGRQRERQESGEIMLEALLVYTVTVFLLLFVLALFSVLFQAWNIQVIANETAAKAAQTYKLADADIVTGYVTEEQITEVKEYRYLWKSSELENAARDKLVGYASDRLIKTTYTKQVGEPEIKMELCRDAFARRHIEVTIQGRYTVPFGEALSYAGLDSVTTYTATARAECLDLMDYVTTVDFASEQASLGQFDSQLVDFLDKFLGLFDTIRGLYTE